MNVASLELCRELYELSGWVTDASYWDADSSRPTPGHQMGWFDENITADGYFPAYDLGYLLRRLKLFELSDWEGGKYRITYTTLTPHVSTEHIADSPEDAAAKLAIELFKQNILTKET